MRKRFKIPLWMLGISVVAVLVTVVWMIRTNWLEYRTAAWANRLLAGTASIRVGIGNLKGSLISNLEIEDMVFVRRDDPTDTLAIVPRLRASYDIRDFWKRRWIVHSVIIDSPRLFVPADSILEFARSIIRRPRQKRPRRPFDFRLQSFQLRDGSVFSRADSHPAVDSINISLSAAREGDWLTVRLDSAGGYEPALGHVALKGTYISVGNTWSVDSLYLSTDRSELWARGTPGQWHVKTEGLDLADAARFVGNSISGRIRFDGFVHLPRAGEDLLVRGRISGDPNGFRLRNVDFRLHVRGSEVVVDSVEGRIAGTGWRGSASLNWGTSPERYTYVGNVAGFRLGQWVKGVTSTNLSGSVRVSGQGLSAADLDLRIDARLGPGQVADFPIDSAIGRLHVTADEIGISDGFVLRTYGTRIIGGGRVGFRDSLDIFANFFCGDLSALDPLFSVDSLAGRAYGYAYLAGQTRDPDLAGRILSDSLQLPGLATTAFEAWFHAPRFLTHPTGNVDVRLGSASLGGWDLDSLRLRANLAGRVVTLDSLSVHSPEAVIDGRGRLDWSGPAIPVVLYPLVVAWDNQRFAAVDTISIRSDSTGLAIDKLHVESDLGHLDVSGRIDRDKTLDLGLRIERVPIAPFWHRFGSKVDLDGNLACTGTIKGKPDNPRLEITGEIQSLTYGSLHLGDLSGAVSYRDRKLQMDELRLQSPDYDIIVSGTLPLLLRLDSPRIAVLDGPLTGHLSATGESLDLVADFLPETIESIRGPFSISGTLGGTPQMPHVTGDAQLRSGVVKVVGISNPIENLQIDLALNQDTVEIRRAVGTMRDHKRHGSLTASGTLRIVSYNRFEYNVALKGRKIPARFEFEDFYAESDFDLNIEGSNPPLVKGRIVPQRVEDRSPFAEEEVETVPDTAAWDWDIVVDLPGNYWIHNDQIDAELSADMRLLRHHGRTTYLGTAEIIRGRVYLFDKTGRIRRGELTFDNVNKPDPRLDIDVGFRIHQPRPEQDITNQGSQILELNFHVGGYASEPLIQPEPPYTEQDVLLLLTANRTFGTGQQGSVTDPWAHRLKFAATGLLFSEVQRIAARKLGLETLEINSAAVPTKTEIRVGRYFSPHLYLYGSSPIDVGSGQEVGFEYRFNRRLFLEGNRDKQNLYRLNIHFNWDY